jgi:hypothetical protein
MGNLITHNEREVLLTLLLARDGAVNYGTNPFILFLVLVLYKFTC